MRWSTTHGTRTVLSTPSNFERNAEALFLHSNFVMIHTEGISSLTRLKMRYIVAQ